MSRKDEALEVNLNPKVREQTGRKMRGTGKKSVTEVLRRCWRYIDEVVFVIGA